MEDDQGIAKLFEPKMLEQLVVNLPPDLDCAEIGTWLIEDYLERVRNSFFVTKENELNICEYKDGSWLVRPARFNDRAHVIHIKE